MALDKIPTATCERSQIDVERFEILMGDIKTPSNRASQQAHKAARIFPTYSSNPKRSNFSLYCKYQLLRHKPWTITPNNAWNNLEPSDDLLTNCWQEFLETSYAQNHVPDWLDKLHNILNHQEQCQEPNELCYMYDALEE